MMLPRLAMLVDAFSAGVMDAISWGTLGEQILVLLESVFLIFAVTVAGALVVYVGAHALRFAKRIASYPAQRQAVTQQTREQHIAELEAESGHGVIWHGTCPSCHASLVLQAQYCSMCGKKVSGEDRAHVTVCPDCHTTNPSSGRYCAQCGARLHKVAV
jgi:hypothetical protein